jgi:hypothetical protein
MAVGTCRDWWHGGSYRNCKLAAVLLTAELQQRWQPDGVVRVHKVYLSAVRKCKSRGAGCIFRQCHKGCHACNEVSILRNPVAATASSQSVHNMIRPALPQLTVKLQTAMAVDPGAVHSAIWGGSRTLGRPPGSWALAAVFSPPWDAAATSAHAIATADPRPAGWAGHPAAHMSNASCCWP